MSKEKRVKAEEKLAELIAQMNAEIAAEKERLKAEQNAVFLKVAEKHLKSIKN